MLDRGSFARVPLTDSGPAAKSDLKPSDVIMAVDGKSVASAQQLKNEIRSKKIGDAVTLDVHRGEVVGLLGPNGAGKTTCFYSVMGLVKPDSGRIFLDGQDVTELPMYRRAILGLGYLPQETSIFRGLTVEQNIMAVLEVAEPDRQARADRLEQLLAEFGLTHLRESAAMALSGGERQRVGAARVARCRPGAARGRPAPPGPGGCGGPG